MITIDAIGKQCPIPLIMTKSKIQESGIGEYEVLVDNEVAVQNLEKMARQFGFASSTENTNDGNFKVTINVADTSKIDAQKTSNVNEITDEKMQTISSNNTVVVIKSQFMGRGDDDLGKILMKGFIFALANLDNPAKTIVFYNSGVKLACDGSETLEDLQKLKSKGVKICACGTCLNHFGLEDKFSVGEVVNMYDIVNIMSDCEKIIEP